ncbi:MULTISPECIES: hypothetical protein [Desulfosporosinus]|uniref:hypothetical protein n=1 Tax=Desulfosporosinus TaxID=79206 RepID=UPI0011610525|nr:MULTISPECIES: hypothetical protein [Desulfosporosinus]
MILFKEKDPMAAQEIPEGWVEGHIILENTENGYRHYVCGVPIPCRKRSSSQVRRWLNRWPIRVEL